MTGGKRGGYAVPQSSWPKRLSDFNRVGAELRVRLTREVKGYLMILPAGTVGTVRAGSRWDRLDFVAERCGHCGVQMKITASVPTFQLIDDQGELLP